MAEASSDEIKSEREKRGMKKREEKRI